MGLLGSPFPRPSLSYCERDRSDEPVRIFYSAEPSVGSKGAIGCSNILSFGKPLEGLKAGNRRSNNRTIYVRMRLTIYLFIYLFRNPNNPTPHHPPKFHGDHESEVKTYPYYNTQYGHQNPILTRFGNGIFLTYSQTLNG